MKKPETLIRTATSEKEERLSEQTFLRMMLPSLLSIILCIICLVGLTWAWMTANSAASAQIIQAAEYNVAVEVTYITNGTVTAVQADPTDAGSATYSVSYSALEAEKEYTVTLIPNGSTKTGYCILNIDGIYYYTNTIPEGGLTFNLTTGLSLDDISTASQYDEALANMAASLVIKWYWGSYSDARNTVEADSITLLSSGDTVGRELTTRLEEKASLLFYLINITADREGGDIATNTTCTVTLTPSDGYTLPESISVVGVSEYTYENGILTIPAAQITDGTEISISAVGDPIQQSITEDTAEEALKETEAEAQEDANEEIVEEVTEEETEETT